MSRLRFRRKENKYTQIYNHIVFKNKNVELVGLYTTIQACIDLEMNTQGTENEFVLSKKTLQAFTGYKDDKFKRIWNDLKMAGYLKQYKIRDKETGKFVYEYELLEEPDITTHHSLIINEDGSIIPNISNSKINKIQENIENENKEIINKLPGGDFPHSGKKGVYYNNLLNKVCMYVEKTQKYFELREKDIELINSYKNNLSIDLFEELLLENNNLLNKVCMYVEKTQKYFELREKDIELINSYKNNLSIDLFEELLLETINKNKSLNYFLSALKNTVANNIKTLEEYEIHKENFIANRSKSKKAYNNLTKKEYSTTRKSDFEHKRTKFHNFDESFTQYSEDELDEIIERSQREKFGCR